MTDDEATFYKILAANQDMLKDIDGNADRIQQDTYDTANGSQIGLTSTGDVAVLLVIDPASVHMLVQAWNTVVDHQCAAGMEQLMFYMLNQMIMFNAVSKALPPNTQNYFPHKDGEHN